MLRHRGPLAGRWLRNCGAGTVESKVFREAKERATTRSIVTGREWHWRDIHTTGMAIGAGNALGPGMTGTRPPLSCYGLLAHSSQQHGGKKEIRELLIPRRRCSCFPEKYCRPRVHDCSHGACCHPLAPCTIVPKYCRFLFLVRSDRADGFRLCVHGPITQDRSKHLKAS